MSCTNCFARLRLIKFSDLLSNFMFFSAKFGYLLSKFMYFPAKLSNLPKHNQRANSVAITTPFYRGPRPILSSYSGGPFIRNSKICLEMGGWLGQGGGKGHAEQA
eukprot:3601357-Rhodomonas_salina.1